MPPLLPPFRTAQSSGSAAATGCVLIRSTSKSLMKGKRSRRARARQLILSIPILCGVLLPNANSGADGNAEARSQERELPYRVISAPFSLELVWIPQGRFRRSRERTSRRRTGTQLVSRQGLGGSARGLLSSGNESREVCSRGRRREPSGDGGARAGRPQVFCAGA